ncbi:MAG: tetratricopeptide repeat protein [Muribaculum sp.]|nr:tetratricopeptide repeat protein [Muribaculaceae bacterium]MCM1081030.1 tetratricopeptide repeat protein [Muribaculum sp.]
MKKLCILALGLLAAASVSAQKNLVNEVEGKAKGFNADFASARAQLQPALTNAESKDDAKTWFVAGSIEFGDYDNQNLQKAAANKDKYDDTKMANALLAGYNYFMTAFPLDTVPEVDKKTGQPKLNKDGSVKVKTKYSKDMVKKIVEHANEFASAGEVLYYAKDFKNAYAAWDIYTSLPFNKSLGDKAPAQYNDTIVGDFEYFKALAALQAQMYAESLAAFDKAISTTKNDPQTIDFAISAAAESKNDAKVIEYAQIGNKLHGDSTVKYINIIINDKINNEKYDEAQQLLTRAIEISPNSPDLHDVLGILYQSQNKLEDARTCFEKAVSLDPAGAKFQFDLGRVIFAQAAAISDSANNLPTAEYNKLREEKVDPILRQAIPYLETALKDEEMMSEAKRILRSLYYSLNDNENLQRIESMNF